MAEDNADTRSDDADNAGLGADRAQVGADAMRASGQGMAEGSSTIGMKIIDQAEQNARQIFAVMREVAGAGDMNDIVKIQGEYLREQSARSMAQAREIILQFGRDVVTPPRGDK